MAQGKKTNKKEETKKEEKNQESKVKFDNKKYLYTFTINDTREVEQKTTKTNEEGEEETVTKKVKKDVPVRVLIRRPSRKEIEQADLERSKKFSEMIRNGILSKAMLTKKYLDVGGLLSEEEAKYLMGRRNRLNKLNNEYVNLALKRDKATKEEKEQLEKVIAEMDEIRTEIANLESNYSYVFQDTADNKALNHVILWYTLMLSQVEEQENEEEEPTVRDYFEGETLDEKLEDYYLKEEEPDNFYMKVRQKLAYFLSFWYNGAIYTTEEFEKLEKDIDDNKV